MNTKGDLKIYQENFVSIVEINRAPNNHFDYQLISDIADVYEDLDKQKDCRVIVLCSSWVMSNKVSIVLGAVSQACYAISKRRSLIARRFNYRKVIDVQHLCSTL